MTHTPWGRADSAEHIARGIVRYSTPSHGGYRVSARLQRQMPAELRLDNGLHGEGWYEEDCDWPRVHVAFPQFFTAQAVDGARRVLAQQAAQAAARAARELATRDQFVAATAWGDWHPNVPAGMVGVVARRAADGAERAVLMPGAEHDAAGFAYVVPDSAQPWGGPDEVAA